MLLNIHLVQYIISMWGLGGGKLTFKSSSSALVPEASSSCRVKACCNVQVKIDVGFDIEIVAGGPGGKFSDLESQLSSRKKQS